MSGKLLAFIVMIWVFGVILGSTFEHHTLSTEWTGTITDAEYPTISTLEYLMNVSNATQQMSLFGIIPLPVPNGSYFTALFQVITLQFSFITGDYMMFYYIVFAPFVVMAVASLIILFIGLIRGNITWG